LAVSCTLWTHCFEFFPLTLCDVPVEQPNVLIQCQQIPRFGRQKRRRRRCSFSALFTFLAHYSSASDALNIVLSIALWYVTKCAVSHQKEILNSVEYEPGFGRFGVRRSWWKWPRWRSELRMFRASRMTGTRLDSTKISFN
jgi:hypothetical protein